jgi:hypothetical protein
MLNSRLRALLLVGCILVFVNLPAQAAESSAQTGVYYSIHEVSANISKAEASSWLGDFLWQEVEEIVQTGARVYSLLSFDLHNGNYGDVVEPYKRQKHFGSWISPQDGDCRNTRALVLVRDSEGPVTMKSNGCTVATGRWSDPYSGQDYTDAGDIQIDHVVPLKNAYISGADKWNQKRRCLYANFMGNPFHLMPVLGSENMRKSDGSPERYMPPNTAFACQYLANWLKIKLIWQLELSNSEKAAIENLAQQNRCTLVDLSYSDRDLDAQRQFIADNKDLCH